MTASEIAQKFNRHENTIRYWARILNSKGIEVEFKKYKAGRRPTL